MYSTSVAYILYCMYCTFVASTRSLVQAKSVDEITTISKDMYMK